jgi:hypothetical protein
LQKLWQWFGSDPSAMRHGDRPAHAVGWATITGDAPPAFGRLKLGIATAGATIMAEPTDPTPGVDAAPPSIERARMILAELAGAAQSAAVALADQQKARAAMQVGVVAEAVRAAARSFERSQSPSAAEYADCAARQIGAVAETIRERHWAEIAADISHTARRRPALFATGAAVLGFVAGRFWTAASRRPEPSSPAVVQATESAVAAGESSGNGKADWPPSEARDLP